VTNTSMAILAARRCIPSGVCGLHKEHNVGAENLDDDSG